MPSKAAQPACCTPRGARERPRGARAGPTGAFALVTGPGGKSCQRRDLLKKLGRTEELRALIDQGDHNALWGLVEVLRAQGRAAEAEALLTRGLTADGRVLETGPAD
ncbi:hypothetical protein [Streptomyces sp. DG1A-41]|uniref:hypothetical protein n=1 Tax=Streptomyces sp. DG1A-41 TaxID=3125779 RepID=UPI0030D3C897